MHPASEPTLALIRHAALLGVPTLFHCGDEEFSLPLQIAEAAAAVPEAQIILGHMGGYFHVRDAIRVAKRHPNLILETSAMPYPRFIKEAVAAIGAERILFASDGPGCDPLHRGGEGPPGRAHRRAGGAHLPRQHRKDPRLCVARMRAAGRVR